MMNRLVRNRGNASSDIPNYTSLTPQAFQLQLGEIIKAYLPLKDALVQSNQEEAQIQANALLSKIMAADMALLKGDVHNYWMKQAKALTTHAEEITSSKELSDQRNQFSFLSASLIEAIQVLGINEDTVFVQHCPMAMNNQGADWLSLQEKINNPYFGEDMLTCGSVTQQLPAPVQQSETNPHQFHNH